MKKALTGCLAAVLLASASPMGAAEKISKEELKDKIAGAWIGQMVGNIYGLPFENKFVDEPASESRFPFGYTKNLDKLAKFDGAFSDDDTDVEYIYLMLMEKYGIEPTYANMREGWMHHIRDRVWLANRAALGLMHLGYTPPFTGAQDLNPHWYQIDPQLINEIWAYTAPGMPEYAVGKSDWAARITSDSWAVAPTALYGAMYSEAFFEKDVRKLIEKGLRYLPEDDRYAKGVRKCLDLYKQYPDDWVKSRQIIAKEFYTDEDPMTKTIWNADLNGLMGILSMLYGKGDFQRTLDLSCAMGFDCDNQAATVSGLLGVMYGAKALPKDLTMPIDGWTLPFNDRYINVTRFDMPDASIQDMINRTYDLALDVVKANGGKVQGNKVIINPKAKFNPPLEFCIGPNPDLTVGVPADYSFACAANKSYKWALTAGTLPAGLSFDNGTLTGTPEKAGRYDITLSLTGNGKTLAKDFNLVVKPQNLAMKADTIYTNVRVLNEAVLDSCWITFGKPMYAKTVDVINDGVKKGAGSVFYSLASASKNPKIDYFGYGWEKPVAVNMIELNTGCLEEFGGWFTSLNIQYLDEEGRWRDVGKYTSTPALPSTDIVFFQPHFAQFLLEFPEVTTRGIRVLLDTKTQDHWHKYTKNVSNFTSITELGVYDLK